MTATNPFRGRMDLISKKVANLVQIGRKTFTLDQFQKVGRKTRLKPDIAYLAGKPNSPIKYLYTTDSRGRIRSAHAHPLQRYFGDRKSHYTRPDGKLQNDQAGHLFAHIFGGSDKVDNIVAQSWASNHEEMWILEARWKQALQDNKTVNVDILVHYGKGDRPVGFTIIQEIGGKPVKPHTFWQ